MGLKVFVTVMVLLAACTPKSYQHADVPYTIRELIYKDWFDDADTSDWIVESEDRYELAKHISGGALDLDVSSGITVWNRKLFEGPLMFEFKATVISAGGVNDRASDLNCFWMATDPASPADFFERSSWRNGTFWNYYSLNLYYVGFGGHDNTKTRMRKYNASAEIPPPVLKEYTDPHHLIIPNKTNVVRIVCFGSKITYSINGEELFSFDDDQPYEAGYFGFRTVDSHIRIEDFTVYSLSKRPH